MKLSLVSENCRPKVTVAPSGSGEQDPSHDMKVYLVDEVFG